MAESANYKIVNPGHTSLQDKRKEVCPFMNPFSLKPMAVEKAFMDWKTLYPRPYDKRATDPYTKTRIILMNGTEYEQVWFSHQGARHIDDNDLKRELALLRRSEQQQQKRISCLKPADETILEHTLSYEQLAVDLTAELAQKEANPDVKRALDFALLEDFDHVFRYANLLDLETGIRGENLLGGYTEITPGRPTIAEHRHPYDSVRRHITAKDSLLTRMQASIITAAEQQTMNYYMNVASFYPTEEGRKLYQEIGMIEEQHVSQYESLIDPSATLLECLLMHEYTECYLYYSCMETESDPEIRALWEEMFDIETAHLHRAAELLRTYENTDWQEVIPEGDFPELLSLHSNIDYVRGVLASQVSLTAQREEYVPVDQIRADSGYFRYQDAVNHDVEAVPSHVIIDQHIHQMGQDYRYETLPNPVEALQDRRRDNTKTARMAEKHPVRA